MAHDYGHRLLPRQTINIAQMVMFEIFLVKVINGNPD